MRVMNKLERQATIKNIVAAKPIARQDELVRLLRRNGYNVTQASVSRDLDELGVAKVNGVYSLPTVDEASSVFGPVNMTASGDSLVVVSCLPGYASAAASKIDNSKIDGVVGTIAGDDTIFVAVKDGTFQRSVIKKLLVLFNE